MRPASPSRIPWPAVVLPLLAVAVLGAVHLPHPLHGDAVLFQTGARKMAQGGTLYRDFWDLKQPGIYVFHALAARLFGFSAIGLHALELVTLLAVSFAQIVLLRRVFSPPWLASFVPIASFGTYYAVTTDWHLTQPAVLLAAPLFTILVAAGLAWPRARAAWMLAGAAGAVAIAFKIVAAPLVLGLMAAGFTLESRARREDERDAAARGAVRWFARFRMFPVFAGIVITGGVVILWLQFAGGWDSFVWTLTSWRADALATRGAHPVERVVESLLWFGKRFAPWLLFAAFAPLGWRGLREERLFVLSAVWLVLGAAIVTVEPFAGWEFDFLMLIVPIAILAMRGVQGLLEVAARRRVSRGTRSSPSGLFATPVAIASALVLTASLPGLVRWIPKAQGFLTHAPQVGASEFDYQRAVDARYETAWRATAFLREADATPGAIYVFGDPLVAHLAGRPQASAVHGWAYEVQPPGVWRRVEQDLRRVQPPYIFVAPEEDALIAERSPGIRELLAESYEVRARNGLGTWYEAAARP